MLGQVLLGPIRLVDFLKVKTISVATNFITIFTKQLIFNNDRTDENQTENQR